MGLTFKLLGYLKVQRKIIST